MIEIVDWGFTPSWLEYAKTYHPRGGRAMRVIDDRPERLEFEAKCSEEFTSRNISFSLIKTFLSIQKPVEGDGYDDGFPHIHAPLHGFSLVHYLQIPKNAPPFHVMEGKDGGVKQVIEPKVGMTIVMANNIYHGVLKSHAKADRIQMVGIAFP